VSRRQISLLAAALLSLPGAGVLPAADRGQPSSPAHPALTTSPIPARPAPSHTAGPRQTTASSDGQGYITATFIRYGMELPRLGWIVPPATVIAREHVSDIFVYSDAPAIERARWSRRITPAELRQLREDGGIACGRAAEYHQYTLPAPPADAPPLEPGQILFTTRPLVKRPSDASMGDSSPDEITDAYKLFGINRRGTLTKAFDLQVDDYVFAFIGFYEAESEEMFAEGIVLYDPSGKAIGSESWDVSDETVCNGCLVPTYDDELDDEFSILNVYRLPHFAAPVLLEETSFGLTGALSLVTFDPQGAYAEYRLTEDLSGCEEPAQPNGVRLAGLKGRVGTARSSASAPFP
jgi:hypothetical protein